MKTKLFQFIKSVLISSIVGFLLYAVSVIFLSAIFENSPYKHFYISCFMVLFYAISFYIVHERKRTCIYSNTNGRFTYVEELKMYYITDGKYLSIIYGISAAIVEISMIITQNAPDNPIGVIFAMVFPLIPYINIPVVRSLLSFLICIICAFILVLIRSRKIIKEIKE